MHIKYIMCFTAAGLDRQDMVPERLTCQQYQLHKSVVKGTQTHGQMTPTSCYSYCVSVNSTFMGLVVCKQLLDVERLNYLLTLSVLDNIYESKLLWNF